VQKVNPSRLPVVVGGLLDVDCSEDIIKVSQPIRFAVILVCLFYSVISGLAYLRGTSIDRFGCREIDVIDVE
jgi:hypothetical protein